MYFNQSVTHFTRFYSPKQMTWLNYFTDINTLGSQCVHSILWQPVKNGPEDDYLLVETCSPHITLCNNKYSRADVQFFSITIRILALRDAFIQIRNEFLILCLNNLNIVERIKTPFFCVTFFILPPFAAQLIL